MSVLLVSARIFQYFLAPPPTRCRWCVPVCACVCARAPSCACTPAFHKRVCTARCVLRSRLPTLWRMAGRRERAQARGRETRTGSDPHRALAARRSRRRLGATAARSAVLVFARLHARWPLREPLCRRQGPPAPPPRRDRMLPGGDGALPPGLLRAPLRSLRLSRSALASPLHLPGLSSNQSRCLQQPPHGRRAA